MTHLDSHASDIEHPIALDRSLEDHGVYSFSLRLGLPTEEVMAFANALPVFTALRVRGLMTLAIFSEDTIRIRQCFRDLRAIQQRLLQDGDPAQNRHGLSMGMSGDYEIAIEEGATVVRVGQAIFGPRPLPNSHYWPGAP